MTTVVLSILVALPLLASPGEAWAVPPAAAASCHPKAWKVFPETQTVQAQNWRVTFNLAIVSTDCELDDLTPKEYGAIRTAALAHVERAGFVLLGAADSEPYRREVSADLNRSIVPKHIVYDVVFFDMSGSETVVGDPEH